MKVASAQIKVDSNNIDFGVLQDDTYIGKLMAEAVCHSTVKLENVAMIHGTTGAEWVRLRYVGFKEEVKKCPPRSRLLKLDSAAVLICRNSSLKPLILCCVIQR